MVEGNEVRCAGREFDQYGRLIARCATGEVPDIGRPVRRLGPGLGLRQIFDRLCGTGEGAAGEADWHLAIEDPPPWEYRARRWDTASKLVTAGFAPTLKR